GIEPGDCQRLCRNVADISVKTGEYVCHEGDHRSLFGILEGRFEAVRLIDGAERVLGQRRPGQVFGEMSIVFGMPHPASLRAAEPSRCFKIETNDYHTIAAAVPAVAERMGKLAAYRMGGPGGLQALVSQPEPARVVLLGRRGDPACAELRRF